MLTEFYRNKNQLHLFCYSTDMEIKNPISFFSEQFKHVTLQHKPHYLHIPRTLATSSHLLLAALGKAVFKGEKLIHA